MTHINSETSISPDSKYGELLVRRWHPGEAAKGAIVLLHGLGEHSGRYERTGSMLASAGYEVIAPDLYGFGSSGGRRGDVQKWDDYSNLIEGLLLEARPMGVSVILMGHSVGGLVCAGYALSGRALPDKLVLSAPALGGGTAWQRTLVPVLARVAPTLPLPNAIKGSELSRDPDVGEAYFADPLVVTKTSARLGAFLLAAQSDVVANLANWSVPTLVMHGGADLIVPPKSTLVLAEVPGVVRRLYPKLRHEILNEPEGPELVSEIVEWLEAQTGV